MNVDGPSYYSVSNLLCGNFFKQNKEKKKAKYKKKQKQKEATTKKKQPKT